MDHNLSEYLAEEAAWYKNNNESRHVTPIGKKLDIYIVTLPDADGRKHLAQAMTTKWLLHKERQT